MKQIITALLQAQKVMGNAIKDSINPFYKSKYSDLNSVREASIPVLNQYGIVVMQPMVTVDGNEYVKTILMHESGETLESFTKILCKAQNDPQAYGSGVTYARRYGLQSLVCIGDDDDDGNSANKEPKKEVIKEKPLTKISAKAFADVLNADAEKISQYLDKEVIKKAGYELTDIQIAELTAQLAVLKKESK